NSPDGSQPLSLLPGPDNALYGVTYAGGSSAGGTIYRINRDGSGYAILANFSTSQTGNSNSPEYEIADGSLGSGIPGFDASSALYYYPLLGGLTVALGNDGYLYGTTFYGGTNNDGTIFKLSRTPGSDLTTLRSFGTTDANPVNVIQGNDGALYGTTFNGGANNFGAIFRLASDGSSYSILHSFSGSLDGAKCPSLIQGSDGMLYGVLLYGTNNTATPSGGTIFRTDTNG